MNQRERIFAVIPAYNEQNAIAESVMPLLQCGYQVVVVDDGSSDDTWQVLQSLPVHRLRHPVNLGQGAALQTGMVYAVRQLADYVFHFDADGQHRMEDIEVLLEPLRSGQADVALGSRFLDPDHTQEVPRAKRVLLRTARLVNFALTGLYLTDAHNGMRAMTRHAAGLIELKENGFAHATEILSQIRHHRLRYVECPTRIRYTEYSQAKGQKISNAFNILFDLVLGRVFR